MPSRSVPRRPFEYLHQEWKNAFFVCGQTRFLKRFLGQVRCGLILEFSIHLAIRCIITTRKAEKNRNNRNGSHYAVDN